MSFKNFGLIGPILKTLEKLEFINPTQIQNEILQNNSLDQDIIGLAQTGSGKTLAFLIPLLQNIYQKEFVSPRKISGLILAPTRELAIQIGETLQPFATSCNIKYTVIFGGVNQFHQTQALKKGVDVIIATPGRLLDLIEQGYIDLSFVREFVLDEADKMLDMGFFPDIEKIIRFTSKKKKSYLFSATFPENIQKLSQKILNNPHTIQVNSQEIVKEEIIQKVILLEESEKSKALQWIVKNEKFNSIVVFVNTKDDTEIVVEYIQRSGISCDSIHRNRSQNARQRALNSLKNKEIKVLVATDVLSRGVDIEKLSCVVNFSLPKDPETYVHRIGRTARAGENGKAYSLCSKEESMRLEKIEELIGNKIEREEDISYKNEIISQREFLGNFSSEKKDKNLKKKRYYKKK